MLAGENRAEVCALAWLNPAETRALLGDQPPPSGDVIVHDKLRALLAQALASHNDDAGSAGRIERMIILAHPADLDAGEITDKGYINQRTVLARRVGVVDLLYADPVPAAVITAERTTARPGEQSDGRAAGR